MWRFYERATIKIPASITRMPKNLIAETSSFKNLIDPSVVIKNTTLANIGYARERSLKLNTRSQITNDKA